MKALFILPLLFLGIAQAGAGEHEGREGHEGRESHEGRQRQALDPAYVEECGGSCHVAFPPRMLDAAGWQRVMGGLERHFGVDASVDAATQSKLARYLVDNASRRNSGGVMRITETPHFRHEHEEELPSAARKAVKSLADCAACHRQAAAGDYSERNIRLPGRGGAQ
jgi:hypothetical protein